MAAKESEGLLHLAHDAAAAGRHEAQNTWGRLKSADFWPGNAQNARRYAFSWLARQPRLGADAEVPAPMCATPYPPHPSRSAWLRGRRRESLAANGILRPAVGVRHSTKFVGASPFADKQALAAESFTPREASAWCGYVRFVLAASGAEFRKEVAGRLAEPPRMSPRYTAPYDTQSHGTCQRLVVVGAGRLAKTAAAAQIAWTVS